MKKIALFILSILLFAACNKNPDTPGQNFGFVITEQEIDYGATEVEIKFYSAKEWTAKSNGKWAALKVTSGSGSKTEQSLKVVVAENDGDEKRKAVIILTDGDESSMFNLYQRPKNPTKVTLLYWNIQDGMWADQANNYSKFIEWVKKYDPDICVWNEAASLYKTGTYTGMSWRTGQFPDGWLPIANKYGHNCVGISYITPPNKNVGYDHFPQVITTRNTPVVKVEDFIGSTAAKTDTVITRRGAWQTVEIAGHTVNFITLHLWPFNYHPNEGSTSTSNLTIGSNYRRAELMYMFQRSILTHPNAKDEYWICLGDFNSRSRMDQWYYNYSGDNLNWFIPHDYIAEATPLIDVVGTFNEGKFCSSTAGSTRIDFVYATPRLMKAVTAAYVPIDDFAVQTPKKCTFDNGTLYDPSDHRPILVTFEIR
ncbi:MAG: hypothetical protein HUJ95_07395 [Bacteroidales bacterium]|nr:hypothetical protein [Bacteroidales bacterium]